MDSYQQFIALSRYARYLPEEQRRETWEETVQRYIDFWEDKFQADNGGVLSGKVADELRDAIQNLEIMPSMRALMTAGPALERDNVAGFNCSYLPIDHPRAFDELMYILLCGTGVGFSVERQYIQKLPEVAESFYPSETAIVVPDSKVGWAKSLRQLISLLYAGEIPQWDTSKVRPAGAALKTFGGRASGPGPLEELFTFTVEVFQGAEGRRLSSLEVHDLCCKIAEVVVVGGVRRSALISLSNPSDGRLRAAKSGAWFDENGQRGMANNSACYTEKPEFEFFIDEMRSLYESKSGERGVFSRKAAQLVAGRNGRRETDHEFGTNPCSEIILRPNQFCNLSEVVVRPEDTLQTLKDKVRKATILGTLQATLTDFRYLRKIWKTNTEEEALLGVSLTGIMDHPLLSGSQSLSSDEFGACMTLEEVLKTLKEVAIETNKEWATKLGINQSTAITCVKPSGTVSQLVNSSSGIHPRWSDHYIRRVRQDDKDPISEFLIQSGVPYEVDALSPTTLVFEFPIGSESHSVAAKDFKAMEQLKLWKIYQDHWCEHKPSCTVYYSNDDFLDICAWVWSNFDTVSGISFLPKSTHSYKQAPYEEITEEEYLKRKSELPDLNWEEFREEQDFTEGSQQLACTGSNCEL
jgi:ribonucleoside-diphosphate reductase alpha chain